MIIEIIVWILLVISAFNVLIVPILFGEDRDKYGYATFIADISGVISLVLIFLMAGKILNWFSF